MKNYNPAVFGLGVITLPTVPAPTAPTKLPTTTTTTTSTSSTTTKKSGWDILDNILNAGEKAADIYDTVKGNSGSGPVYTSPTNPVNNNSNSGNNNTPPPANDGLSTGAKVGIAAGAVSLLVGGIYLATRGDKKKGLGCPDAAPAPAPTPALNGPRRRKKRR